MLYLKNYLSHTIFPPCKVLKFGVSLRCVWYWGDIFLYHLKVYNLKSWLIHTFSLVTWTLYQGKVLHSWLIRSLTSLIWSLATKYETKFSTAYREKIFTFKIVWTRSRETSHQSTIWRGCLFYENNTLGESGVATPSHSPSLLSHHIRAYLATWNSTDVSWWLQVNKAQDLSDRVSVCYSSVQSIKQLFVLGVQS